MPAAKPSRCAARLLRYLGWSLVAEPLVHDKFVLIVAPHTSNWDFPLGMLANWALGLNAQWMGKHTLFRKPLGGILERLGGIPIHRAEAGKRTEQMALRFASAEHLVLTITPEGTRGQTDHWKSGFWHIARAAQVPIVMACFDYQRKCVRVGGAFMPGSDIDQDFEHIRTWLGELHGKLPGQAGQVRPRPVVPGVAD